MACLRELKDFQIESIFGFADNREIVHKGFVSSFINMIFDRRGTGRLDVLTMFVNPYVLPTTNQQIARCVSPFLAAVSKIKVYLHSQLVYEKLVQSLVDPCVYTKNNNSTKVIIILWVDNLIIARSNMSFLC